MVRRRPATQGTTVGAVVGGTALAPAGTSPAAATAAVLDGTPAVAGTAHPNTGVGIFGPSTLDLGVGGRMSAGAPSRPEGIPAPPPGSTSYG